MPADSEVTVPHTWRPFGVRIAGFSAGAFLVVICAFAWFAFPPDIRAEFSGYQRGTLVFLGLLVAACIHALVRCRATASQQRLTVVNGYRRHDFEWAQVVAITMPRGAPWAVLDLDDGSTCKVLAIQAADGPRARQAVRQVRALLP